MIRIGTAGFSYRDWEGIVYPAPPPDGFRPLAHLARFFDCIEMNTTFYGVPKPESVQRWVQEVADRPDFRFTFKLYRGLTHATNDDASLQPFLEALEPCRAAKKLGAILLQFPFFFRNTRPNRARLASLATRLEGWPCAVEVRDDSWLIDPALDFMQRLRLSLCDIDICQAKNSVPPASLTTGEIGYVRLHGRNAEAWFDKRAPAEQKYNYLYSDEELDRWVRLVREIAAQTHETYVITNNHFEGKAVANAFSLARRLTDNPPSPPDDFVEHYPHLHA